MGKSNVLKLLAARLESLEARHVNRKRELARRRANPYAKYLADPVGFARDLLKVSPTPDQVAILEACTRPPHRVKIKAGHSVGKTFLLAVVLVWFYCTRTRCVAVTTAPTQRDVIDLLWAEVRRLAGRAGLALPFLPADPQIFESEDRYAKGYTARKGESFQGRHAEHMLFLFDESEGLDASYYKTTKTMFVPGGKHLWVDTCNPTTTTSESYAQEGLVDLAGEPLWNLVTLSCLTHPNVVAGLKGDPPPVPGAVTVEQVDGWVAEWCDPLPANAQPEGHDFEWRPGSGRWYRPGPVFVARVKGLRPPTGADGVWAELDWDAALDSPITADSLDRPELGVDVARYGLDWSSAGTRRGPAVTALDTWSGHGVDETAGRVVRAVVLACDAYFAETGIEIDPKEVPIKIDDDGVGGGVADILSGQGYAVTRVNAQSRPDDPASYPRVRDELWFRVAMLARSGRLSLARLPASVIARLRPQALLTTYRLTSGGQRQVESKDSMKERTGRSPDDMDAVNLSFAPAAGGAGPSVIRGRRHADRRRD